MKKHYALTVLLLLSFSAILFSQENDLPAKKTSLIKTLSGRYRIEDKKILYAIELIERELFIPESFQKYAYNETSIPLVNGKTIPSVTELVKILNFTETKESRNVLVIGSNGGYTAALFSYFYDNVYLIETDTSREDLYISLFTDKYSNINIEYGNNPEAFKGYGPFDFIFLQGSISRLDPVFFDMLQSKGEIIFPLESSSGLQQIVRYRKVYGEIWISSGDVSFYPSLF